jgi:glutamate synthase domain-containing protein 1
VWRYFLEVKNEGTNGQSEDEYVVDRVMEINTKIEDAFVFSSGKNMGVFKGVGYPEEIAEYFCLEQYEGYLWTAHGRFPTNTPGWWGGAHPFNILDWTVVHNGEISSYGINRRYLEQFGYNCTMQTDTEVVAYAIDLLMRRHGLPVEIAAKVLAPPLWSQIERCSPEGQRIFRTLRQVYGSLLLNGPFTVIIAHQGEMIGLTDRIKLRPLTVGVKGSVLYLSSEESAIRLVCPDLDRTWIPMGGEPIVGSLKKPLEPAVIARSTSDVAISDKGCVKISK